MVVQVFQHQMLDDPSSQLTKAVTSLTYTVNVKAFCFYMNFFPQKYICLTQLGLHMHETNKNLTQHAPKSHSFCHVTGLLFCLCAGPNGFPLVHACDAQEDVDLTQGLSCKNSTAHMGSHHSSTPAYLAHFLS